MNNGIVFLIPCWLHEEAATAVNAVYLIDHIRQCQVFFAENERSARRFFKSIWKEMVIDDYEWHTIHKAEEAVQQAFAAALEAGKNIGIISEAGCPGIADPGQQLAALAQRRGAVVKPLVGPNSILLALMASGMNGQNFRFNGYLPIDAQQRMKALRESEAASAKENCTQIFIETPYRNNQLLEAMGKCCKPTTRLCIAVDLTAPTELVQTKSIGEWAKKWPDIHKRPAIFCLLAG
jgi:16S rRNA (cytidine1402-2'-O)-methyltransferase